MNVLLDTNVIVDVLLTRDPWSADSSAVWGLSNAQVLNAFISASSVTDIFYVMAKLVGKQNALLAVKECLDEFQICPVEGRNLKDAYSLPGPDFEDNLQIVCARVAKLDAIVTRNIKDFTHSPILVMTPTELLEKFKAGQ